MSGMGGLNGVDGQERQTELSMMNVHCQQNTPHPAWPAKHGNGQDGWEWEWM